MGSSSFVFPGQNHIKDRIQVRSTFVSPSPARACIQSVFTRSYNISKGALYRIKHDRRLSSKSVSTRSIFRLSKNEEGAVVECIKEFLDRNIYRFNANDVYNHVHINLGMNLLIHKIRNILRENFHLSYKRISSRPCFIDISRLKRARMLFSIRLLSTINQSILLINIDETLIIKDTKSNYSWTPIGKIQKYETADLNHL